MCIAHTDWFFPDDPHVSRSGGTISVGGKAPEVKAGARGAPRNQPFSFLPARWVFQAFARERPILMLADRLCQSQTQRSRGDFRAGRCCWSLDGRITLGRAGANPGQATRSGAATCGLPAYLVFPSRNDLLGTVAFTRPPPFGPRVLREKSRAPRVRTNASGQNEHCRAKAAPVAGTVEAVYGTTASQRGTDQPARDHGRAEQRLRERPRRTSGGTDRFESRGA